MTPAAILEKLVGFASVSSTSNREIAGYIEAFLQDRGAETETLWSEDGQKVNLFATLGPRGNPGIILSGHTDVVPTEGQAWTGDPFRLRETDGRYYGRGAADMKGFLACVLSLIDRLDTRTLKAPLHLCFSHDEEIGCVGVRPMLAELKRRSLTARLCLVGEPTLMRVATGHKGKLAARLTCVGREGHSALAPRALNAIHLAADLVGVLRRLQDGLRQDGARDTGYDIPYSTLHVGLIAGGTALNIVPNRCTLDYEIRTVGADDPTDLMRRVEVEAAAIVARARGEFPEAAIDCAVVNRYPGLDTSVQSEAVAFMTALTGHTPTIKVAFGTEGGLFQEALGIPTLVCGPGSMDQGHRPDEFIDASQLDACDRMLDRLAASLAS